MIIQGHMIGRLDAIVRSQFGGVDDLQSAEKGAAPRKWLGTSHDRVVASVPRTLSASTIRRMCVLGVASAGIALGGCGLSTLTSGLSGSMFGGSADKPPSVESVTEEQLLSAAKAEYGEGGVNVGQVAHGCPEFAVWPAEHHVTIYEPGMTGDSLAVMHRGEITRTARECAITNGQVAVKYGFSGRILLGPRGQSGRVTLPVNVFVTDEAQNRLLGEDLDVGVDVSLENPIGYFSTVRTVTFNVPQGSRPGDYKVYVGFKRLPAS